MTTRKQTKSNRREYKQYKGNTKYIHNKTNHSVHLRPLLLSSEDEESMAVHSAKARMLIQTKKTQALRKYTRVVENINSNNRNECQINPITASAIPKYKKSIQNIRWYPYMETCFEEPQFNARKPNYMYQYKNYEEPYLQDQNKVIENKKIISFKDNIVRYSDSSTMTWTMNDVACGVDILIVQNPNAKVNESTTYLTKRDRSQSFTSHVHYLPVLEKSECQEKVLGIDFTSKNHEVDGNIDLPNSNHDNYKTLRKFNRKEAKMSDVMVPAHDGVKRFPNLSISMAKLSKISHPSIPEDCKMSLPDNHRVHAKDNCDCTSICDSHDHNVFITKLNFKNDPNLIQCKRSPSIRLPKRVVTSQRNIKVFTDKHK